MSLFSKAGQRPTNFLKKDSGMAVFLEFPKKGYYTEHLGGVTNLRLCFIGTIDLQITCKIPELKKLCKNSKEYI